MILGLTGSLGSGKSTVARMFAELGGAAVIDADAITHEVQRPGGPAYDLIVQAFGTDILLPDGAIDRKKLASVVFSDEEKRRFLNSLVHPVVRTEELRLLSQYRNRDLVILMVPLLFENKMEHLADRTAVVTLDEESRRKRLWERSRMSDEEITQRLQSQMPDSEKISLADYVINNSGSLQETRDQVQQVIDQLKQYTG